MQRQEEWSTSDPMTKVMGGVRVLEVADHMFVPAATALLADWGADVIKIEHIQRGDAMRGHSSGGGAVAPLLEHANRGKRSLALDLTTPDGVDIVYRLAAGSDVFVTNKLAGVRRKLRIDLEDIRSHSPDIIYVRGSGQGERGPDADRGSYDYLAFWARAGVAKGTMQPADEFLPQPPSPGFGDSVGAMTIAGGVMGALFHRSNTGEASVVDVSLLGTGLWAMGAGVALSLYSGSPWLGRSLAAGSGNPLVGAYPTKDGRFLVFACQQPAKYWPHLCEVIGRPDLASDARFADFAALRANALEATVIVRAAILERSLDEWLEPLSTFEGQWAVAQNTLEAAADAQTVANGYLADATTSAGTSFTMVTAPVQYDEQPAPTSRCPDFNEHGDAILADLGFDWDSVIDLKLRGIVA